MEGNPKGRAKSMTGIMEKKSSVSILIIKVNQFACGRNNETQ